MNGYIDYCTQAGLVNFRFLPSVQIEWDQTTTSFYTGQNITFLWDTMNLDSKDLFNISYISGTGNLRFLATNVNTSLGSTTERINDFTINVVDSPVYITASLSSPQLAFNTTLPFTVILSKVINIDATVTGINGNQTSIIGSTVFAGTDVNVSWQGLGMAAFPYSEPGNLGVSIRLSKLGPGSITRYFEGGANNTVNFMIPLDFSGSAYSFSITIYPFGRCCYTGTTNQFRILIPPSSSSTPSPTPSETSTPSLTPSTTETARPSIDLDAIARAAQNLNDQTTGVIIAAILGTGVTIIGAFLIYLSYQRRKLTQARLHRLKESVRWAQQGRDVYFGGKRTGNNMEMGEDISSPPMVVYQVNVVNTSTSNGLPSRSNIAPQSTGRPVGRGGNSNRRLGT